jgi:orotate phosphoribosyltransferase
MDRRELAERIYRVSHLSGAFVLRSGQTSREYFDKYLFESDPHLLAEIADHLSDMIPDGTQMLAGLEMGGIPIATTLSLRTGIPVVFMRKKAKEYGTRKCAEGSDVMGKQVCIIEDVVTTGGQIVLSARDLRSLGAEVRHVLCVIERDPRSEDNLAKEELELSALFSMADLESTLHEPETR